MWYLYEGNNVQAGISFAGAILPYVGDILKLAKGASFSATISSKFSVGAFSSADRVASGLYHAGASGGVGGVLGGSVAFGAGIYQGKDWSDIGSDTLSGAGWGLLQGAAGGYVRGRYFSARIGRASTDELMNDVSIGKGRLNGDIISVETIERLASRLARNGVTIDRSANAVTRLNARKAGASFLPAEDGSLSATLFLRPDATRYEIAHELKHYTDWLADRAAFVQRALAYRSVLGGPVYERFAKASSKLAAERYAYDELQKTHFHRLDPLEIKHAQDYLRDVQQNFDFWRKLAK